MFPFPSSDPYKSERVKSYDRQLHQRLVKIILENHERCLTSDEIKQHLRSSSEHTDQNSIINQIREQKPFTKMMISKEDFDKLSLLWITVLASYHNSAELLVITADVNELYRLRVAYQPLELNEKSSILHAMLPMFPSILGERATRTSGNRIRCRLASSRPLRTSCPALRGEGRPCPDDRNVSRERSRRKCH